ncbi:extracellular solute-binding protein [Chitiniphilus purpureus]|uniref:Extracellular solute-binding protein n=1 Tax=Chitiniphilus purpureus TaxID=2981137 RepID=A0ABY6DNE1_9NEIS|nr:extracellular solute-binding protein [Chitiniphilus sp. CD1]UXY15188.1 extracellular solute-binding protein [Chitiniphilus sp. CD1]
MKQTLIAMLVGGLFASGAAHAEKVKVEFWTMSMKPRFENYFQNLVKQYEAQNPDVDIVWTDLPWDVIRSKFTAAVAAGQPPALANMNVEWAYDYMVSGAIQPIDNLLGKDRAMYMPGALADVTWKGKSYAFPWYNSADVMIVNAEIFKKAGLDPNKPIKNLSEQLKVAKQIKQKAGMAGLAPRLGRVESVFMGEGLPVLEGNKAVFNSPKHVALLREFADAYKAGALLKDNLFAEDNFQVSIAAYNGGRLGILETTPPAVTRVRDDAKEIYAVSIAHPVPPGATGVVKGGWLMDFVVPRGVDPKLLPHVGKFAKFLTNDANQLEFSRATGGTYPSTRKAALDPFFQEVPANAGAVELARAIGAKNLANVRTLAILGIDDPAPLLRRLREETEAAVTGRKDPKAAMDAAVAFWNAQLKKK